MEKALPKEVAALGTVLQVVKDLDERQQRWVFDSAMTNLGLERQSVLTKTPPGGGGVGPKEAHAGEGGGGDPGAKEFLKAKNPQSDVQRVACLAYYLSHYRGQASFKTKDLTALNVEAAGANIGNPSQAVNNAAKQSHYLTPAGGGKKQISAFGEDVVEALPDQAAVKAVEQNKPRKRKGGRRNGGRRSAG